MSLFRRPGRRAPSARAISEDVAFGGIESAGLAGSDRALRLVPLYAAVGLLSDSIASLPLQAHRRNGDGTRARVDVTWPVPARLTRYSWLQQAAVGLLLRGNAYGLVTMPGTGSMPEVVEWLPPQQVTVNGGRVSWSGRVLPEGRVLHIPGFMLPGAEVGLSPVGQFAAAIDTGLAAEAAARDWYVNGATPSQSLRNRERVLDASAAATVKARYMASTRTGEPFVHGADWELSAVGVSAADAQFLDAIKANATTIAAIYRVPPEKIGGVTGASLTYSTTEQQSIDFVLWALRPWLVRIEEALSVFLPDGVRASFATDALVRVDLKTRTDAMASALDIGVLTLDEARALEDRPPLTDRQVADWLGRYRRAGATDTGNARSGYGD